MSKPESQPEALTDATHTRIILIQSPFKSRPVNMKHFNRVQKKDNELFYIYHQLIIGNHQTGVLALFCPICKRFMQHSEDKIEPMSQSEENGGWT